MRTNRRCQSAWSGLLAVLLITLLVCVPDLSIAQPVEGDPQPAATGGAVGDFVPYALVFAASVLILASALAVLIVAVAREVFRAPASALASRQWQISLVAGNAALFGILLAELFLFFALQSTGVTRPASASSARDGTDEMAAAGASAAADATVQDATPPVDAESIGPDDPREITLGLNEKRWFRLTEPDSGEYVIEVHGASAGFDAYLSVVDEDGKFLEADDDGGDGTDSSLAIVLEDDRTYYVVVQERFGYAGRCSLSVQPSTG